MQAPIPAVPQPKERIEKPRPAGLKVVTLLMCASEISALFRIGPDFGRPIFQTPFFITIMILGYLILWYFWRGYNWARILVLLRSAITLCPPFFFAEQTAIQNVISSAEMVLGIFLLYWLNTKPIREYFKQPIVNKSS